MIFFFFFFLGMCMDEKTSTHYLETSISIHAFTSKMALGKFLPWCVIGHGLHQLAFSHLGGGHWSHPLIGKWANQPTGTFPLVDSSKPSILFSFSWIIILIIMDKTQLFNHEIALKHIVDSNEKKTCKRRMSTRTFMLVIQIEIHGYL